MSSGTRLSFYGRGRWPAYEERIYPSNEELGTPLHLLRGYYDAHPLALLKYLDIHGVVKIYFPFERRSNVWLLHAQEGVVVSQHHMRAGWCAIEPELLMMMLSDIAPRPVFGPNMHLEMVACKRGVWRIFVS